MKPTTVYSPYRRWVAGFLAVLIGLGPIATPSYAALTSLADEPLNVRNQSKPNIMFTVDDSSSMLYDFLPDYVVEPFCRDNTGVMRANCGNTGANNDFRAVGRGAYRTPGYIYKQFGASFPAYNPTPAYDASGPGEGCSFVGSPFCAPGVDPGPLPGIKVYPAGTAKAGQPYDYSLLWPAPVHNSAFNHIYYNPRFTYDPPSNSDGSPFPQMNAGNTTTWTRVPADPWASTITYVDLTAPVTVGLWCNSDWSQGLNPLTGLPFATDVAHCRTNGVVGAASQGAAAADGDYAYPWRWPGAPAAKDPQYFYQNDNTLWCDTSSPDWPQTGAPVAQSCNGSGNTVQLCNGVQAQTCSAGNPQVCNNIRPQVCNGFINQTCNNITTPQTCGGATGQTCGGLTPQTCGNVQAQTCGGINPQSCNGSQTQTCNPVGQSCNNVRPQTCAGIHQVDPDPALCTSAFDPPGCNLCTSECGPCTLTPVCPPPTFEGNCSLTNLVCTAANAAAVCPTLSGTCSNTGAACFANGDCGPSGRCSIQNNVCNGPGDCGTLPGACSVQGNACTSNAQCPNAGACTVTNATCNSNADCPTQAGTCTVSGAGCFDNTGCPPANGACTATAAACTSNADCLTVSGACTGSGGACTANVDCANTGVCSTTGSICLSNANCPILPGTCSVAGNVCNSDANCPTLAGTCSTSGAGCFANAECGNTGRVCSIDSSDCSGSGTCPDVSGTCNITAGACASAASCPLVPIDGTCSVTGAACQGGNPGPGTCPVVPSPGSGATCSDTVASTLLLNRSFEGPAVGAGNYLYAPAAASWVFAGAGIQSNGSGWGAAAAPDGTQTAFIQNNGQISQTVNVTVAGTYVVSFSAAQRGGQINPIQVYIDGSPMGGPLTPASSAFGVYSTAQFALSTGSHVLSLRGTSLGPDNSSFIDAVGLNPVTGGAVRTLLRDSATDGKVCRRNNQPYAATSVGARAEPAIGAGRFNYPDANFRVAVTGGTGPDACVVTDRYQAVPRHYWKTEVEWCDRSVGTAGDKWTGYGTPTLGSCQPSKDATHLFPRFYKFGASAGTDNYATPAFQRVDLISGNTYTHTWTDDELVVQTVTRSYIQEMTNYANWFAYYRTRILAVKTVSSLTFKEVDDQSRVGFHTLSNVPATSFVGVSAFNAAQKLAWFAQLFNVNISALDVQTPTLNAIIRVGEYYSGSAGALPISPDPVVLSCQKNFHMLFTDGFTNQAPALTSIGDEDDTIPVYPDFATKPIPGLVPAAVWPTPFREDPARQSSGAAADLAMHYWVTDIRPGVCALCINNVGADPSDAQNYLKDPAAWQHVNFAAISLGTAGDLPADNTDQTASDIRAGTVQWPKPQPSVNRPDQSGVDDLWHAAINGHGDFVNAQDIDDLKIGMGRVLALTSAASGARAGVGLSNGNLTISNRFVYRGTFGANWSGSLTKVELDPANSFAEIGPVWNADSRLATLLTPTLASAQPWKTDRKVVTLAAPIAGSTAGPGVPFLWTNLTAAQQNALAPGNPTRGQSVLEFLRGNRAREGTRAGRFRVRPGPLGDIVDSQSVVVGPPGFDYIESPNPGYAAFKSGLATRPTRVYVGANDGMLHAFDDATGDETFAYVPKALYRPDPTGLLGLAIQDGAIPPFRHHFLVDASPRMIDANFAGAWHSMLVGGLGKGGKAYYALDVTNPSGIASETDAANRVLWEFSTGDLGYTYGKPIIAKTRGFGGKWLVVVPSGYNNLTGEGQVFFLDAADGSLLKTLHTNAGTPGTPSGLAHISGWTIDYRNQVIEQIYGGDLLGNVWRFDVSNADESTWGDAVKIAVLTDPISGLPQPVTSAPAIDVDVINGVDRWVFVGTGKLLDNPDLLNTQRQTLYAIRDGTLNVPNTFAVPLDARTALSPLLDRQNGLAAKPPNGWYDDLPAGERIITAPQSALSVVAYSGALPQTDECLTGQPADVYIRDFSTGASLQATPGFLSAEGAVGLDIVTFPVADGSPPDVRLAITLGTTGQVIFRRIPINPLLYSHRLSWRLLSQ